MRQALLHSTFMDLVFDPEGESTFTRDPQAFGADHGLDALDQESLARNQRGLRVYKALIRSSVLDPIPDCFPILNSLLEAEGAWTACLDAFFCSRSVQSLYYRDVNPSFLAWLAESAWGQDRWPFLLQLAHFEYVELELLLWPDPPPMPGLGTRPTREHRAIFDGAFRNLAYDFRVHETDVDSPTPLPGTVLLVGLRNLEGHLETQEVDGPTSAFLARLQEGALLGPAAEAVGLTWDQAETLLQDLRARGGILGFQD